MAIPDGLQVMEAPVPLACFSNEDSKAAQGEYLANAVPTGKTQLAAALEKYEKEHGTF